MAVGWLASSEGMSSPAGHRSIQTCAAGAGKTPLEPGIVRPRRLPETDTNRAEPPGSSPPGSEVEGVRSLQLNRKDDGSDRVPARRKRRDQGTGMKGRGDRRVVLEFATTHLLLKGMCRTTRADPSSMLNHKRHIVVKVVTHTLSLSHPLSLFCASHHPPH